MSYIPTVEQAHELLERYNKEPFHIQHGETVSWKTWSSGRPSACSTT